MKGIKLYDDKTANYFLTPAMIKALSEMNHANIKELSAIHTQFDYKEREKRLLMFLRNPVHLTEGLSNYELAASSFPKIFFKDIRHALRLASRYGHDTNKFVLGKRLFSVHSVWTYVERFGYKVYRWRLLETAKDYQQIKDARAHKIAKERELDQWADETFAIPLRTRRKKLHVLLDEESEKDDQ